MTKKNNKSNIKKIIGYTFGSVALFAATTYIITKYGSNITGYINKYMSKVSNIKHDNDDWGPEIIKK